jgi:CRISPR-associated protein (TIGR02710 family)
MANAVIVSVGGTKEPIVNTLRAEHPGFVCFLASHQSVDQIADIKREVAGDFADEKVLIDDPEDLVGCYRQALESLRRVEARGFARSETIVDYTGGTKAMTAALAMAAASLGVCFSYVGGHARTKGGLGVVTSGSERRRVEVDPLRLFAVEEKRRIALYFNRYQYLAAAAALRELLPSQGDRERLLLESMLRITEAYAAWDRFDHTAALEQLPAARRQLAERARVAETSEYGALLDAVERNIAVLGELCRKTKKFSRLHPALAADLLANADRRMLEGKYDDAVARLYRALELLGQCAFEEQVGVATGKVPVDQLPARLQEEFARKYADESRTAKLPLAATYQVLAELGHPAGRRFRDQQEDFRKIMNARNESILAHGRSPVAEGMAKSLRALLAGFLLQDAHLPEFPRLPW